MNISVNLQEPFSYELWPIITLGTILLLGIVAVLASILIKRMPKEKKEALVVAERTPEQIEKIRNKYLGELAKIENDYNSGKLSDKIAYQKMSVCIRKFVHEVTGIKVQNYTLLDIQRLGMPMLEQLISEYYEPEFAKKSNGDFVSSLAKTKRVIEEWK